MRESITIRGILAGFCVAVTVAAGAFATEAPPLESGARVRATVIDTTGGEVESREVSGTLVSLDEITITMKDAKSDSLLDIPREDIAILETRVQESHKLQGTLIGLGVGAVLGAMVGYSGGDDPPGIMSMEAETKAAAGAVSFGLIGALIGALASPGEQWQDIPADKTQLGFGRCSGGGNGIFITRRF